MRAKLFVLICVAATLLVGSSPILAHHGNAAFDTSSSVTIRGSMTDLQFVNPHVRLFFDVK